MPEPKKPTIDERLEKLRRQCEELAESCHELLREIRTGTDPATEPKRFPVKHAISCRKLREEVEAKKHKKQYS